MKWFKLIIVIFSIVLLSGCNPLNKHSKSGLQVITDNVESAVFLNDQYLEKAPFINREIKPGEYILKIQPDDLTLAPYETKVKLNPGLLTVVTWKLAKRPELSGGVIYEMEPIRSKNKSEVSFVSIPDGAIVSLQGKEKDFAPTIITDVNPGHNEFEVSLPSYESQKHTINVVAGYRMLVNVKLAKINIDGDTSNYQENKENIQKDQDSTTITATKSGEIGSPTLNQVLIKKTNFFIEGKEVLRVRNASSSAGKELGFVVVGEKYPYSEIADNDWINITFNNLSGWISSKYAQIIKE